MEHWQNIDKKDIVGEYWVGCVLRNRKGLFLDYSDLYKISNYGRIKVINTGTILTQQISNRGYRHVLFWRNGKAKKAYSHILIGVAFVSNPLNKPQLNHLDGVKLNCEHSNLKWATSLENIRHAIETGLTKKAFGSKASKAKLTEIQAMEVLNSNLSSKELSLIYGITQRAVRAIKTGVNWKYLNITNIN